MRRGKAKGKQIKKGSFVATLYKAKRTIAGRPYHYFRLAYHEPGGRRVIRDFGNEGDANKAATDAAKAFALGRPDALSFRPEERQEYDAAEKLLDGTGASVYAAVQAYIGSLSGQTYERRTVAEVVAELIADAKARKLSPEHVSDTSKRLARFADDFQCQIGAVTPALLLKWLRGLKAQDGTQLSNRTKFNFQRHVVGLFRFAARLRYIPRTLADEVAELDKPKPEAAKAEIFTPKECAAILNKLPDDMIPAFVLGAFAGLRPAEIARLDWSDIRMEQKVLIVGAHQAKTASRRVVPLSDNLVEWLLPHTGEGRICPVETPGWMAQKFTDGAKLAGVDWKRNALRHSYISYRLAITADPARVATESGNSAAMVHAHYKALVTEAEAKSWFDIRPTTPSNVIALPATA
ncbi:MAG: tyrosine-type recombinase/integrase [Verrucomicrobia bacterium]|nr:tyrosine-type recombinase/integrase [Verrucomicrobiota bacterium]